MLVLGTGWKGRARTALYWECSFVRESTPLLTGLRVSLAQWAIRQP